MQSLFRVILITLDQGEVPYDLLQLLYEKIRSSRYFQDTTFVFQAHHTFGALRRYLWNIYTCGWRGTKSVQIQTFLAYSHYVEA